MAAKEVMHLLAGQEHTEANWLEAWPLIRQGTALEPHDVDLLSVSDEALVMRMEVGPHAHQPFGLLHGGMSMLLAESAASMHACWGLDLPQNYPVGIEINGSHIRSTREGAVLTKATVIRRSSTLIHHDVKIIEESTGRELSIIRVTNLLRQMG